MKNARVLVVDDESNIRLLLEEILSEEGYDVTTAEDAATARAAKVRQDFELFLNSLIFTIKNQFNLFFSIIILFIYF